MYPEWLSDISQMSFNFKVTTSLKLLRKLIELFLKNPKHWAARSIKYSAFLPFECTSSLWEPSRQEKNKGQANLPCEWEEREKKF